MMRVQKTMQRDEMYFDGCGLTSSSPGSKGHVGAT